MNIEPRHITMLPSQQPSLMCSNCQMATPEDESWLLPWQHGDVKSVPSPVYFAAQPLRFRTWSESGQGVGAWHSCTQNTIPCSTAS
jgi:hypothetical protein